MRATCAMAQETLRACVPCVRVLRSNLGLLFDRDRDVRRGYGPDTVWVFTTYYYYSNDLTAYFWTMKTMILTAFLSFITSCVYAQERTPAELATELNFRTYMAGEQMVKSANTRLGSIGLLVVGGGIAALLISKGGENDRTGYVVGGVAVVGCFGLQISAIFKDRKAGMHLKKM